MNLRSLSWFVTISAIFVIGLPGCAKQWQQPECPKDNADLRGCSIEEVDFEGNDDVSSGDISEKIATAETSRLLGGAFRHTPILSLWDAISVEYERFDRFVLERDMARVQRYYRARGFYDVRVRAGRVERLSDGTVRVEIVIEEGVPILMASIEIKWKDWTFDKALEVTRHVTDAKNKLSVGDRFEEEPYEDVKKQIKRALTDRGFAYANVDGEVNVNLAKHEAYVTYTIELGPRCRFGELRIEGLGSELPEAPVRQALDIEPGEAYSTDKLDAAQNALANLGVFGAIDVDQRLSKDKNPIVPITFTVQPAALRSIKVGGGVELGSRFETHLVTGWENRNFLGGLRRFSIEARPGLVFYPMQVSTLFSQAPTRILPELQVRTELRQPGAIEARTTAVLRGAFKLYRLQTSELDSVEANAPDQEPNLVGYREFAGAIGLERPFLKSALNVAVFYNVQRSDPFSYNYDEPPEGFRGLLIPYFETTVSYDLRKDAAGKPDRISPNKGIFVSTNTQVAGYLYGDADDVRIQPEFRGYVPVSKKVTLGFRLLFGFLFPQNYGDAFSARSDCSGLADPNLLTPENEAVMSCDIALERDLQLLQFRAFFSGGANSNRGYGYNEVGPHGSVPSITGGQVGGLVPTGGLSLWESSLELRIPIAGELGLVLFADASDVGRQTSSFRLSRPHLSTGLGLRYNTPVGPLRLDAGYRVPCAQVIGFCPDDPLPEEEGMPTTTLGLPIAVSIAIGEAF